MKYIHKDPKKEPASLRVFRDTTPNASYDGLGSIKKDIRSTLTEEQGFLCAYCMSRIDASPTKMEIEHFISQKHHHNSPYSQQFHKDNELRYENMLGTCQGYRCCSGIRENVPLTISPTNTSCERLIQFSKNGVAFSNDVRIKADIITLKLNDQVLQDNRQKVIDKAREALKLKHSKIAWNNEILNQEITDWLSLKNSRYGQAYQEYCMAAVHYLQSQKRQ